MLGRSIELKDSRGNAFRAYLSQPKGGRGPGMVIGIDIWGFRKLYFDIADLFAERGYVTIVPDYFWDVSPGTDGSYKETVNFSTCIEATRASIFAVRGLPECNGKVGVTGFCIGGSTAFLSVARFGADAAASYYGTRIHMYLDEVNRIEKPVLLHIVEHDPTYSDEDRDRILSAVKGHPMITTHLYSAPHGFASSSYTPDAAALAHERTFALFETLK